MERSLYQKYRPQAFDEVVGQQHVTRTLRNALASTPLRVANAYLFTGPRGTGKTTTARILAKALNCEQGAGPTPCGVCDSCSRVATGNSIDVLELDAASNTSVDNVRDVIISSINYAPAQGAYRVYIVDEVHMLSNSAFNALLKTLEEPPPHALFILATTDPQKLPPTVISRCQRFDFRRIGFQDIADHLADVCQREGVTAEPAAINLVVRAADGGLRDALSILDQIITYSGDSLAVGDVTSILGMTGTEVLLDFSKHIAAFDRANLLTAVDGVVCQGHSLVQLLKDLANHFRDILLLSVNFQTEEISHLPDATKMMLQERAKALPPGRIAHIIETLCQAQNELRWNPNQRLVLELAMLRATEQPAAALVAAAPPAAAPAAQPGPARHEPQPRRRSAPAQSASREAPGPPPTVTEAGELADVRARWPEILARIRAVSVPIHSLFVDAVPVHLSSERLVLAFQNEFHRDQIAENRKNLDLVTGIINQHFARDYHVQCRMSHELDLGGPKNEAGNAESDSDDPDGERSLSDPDFERHVLDLFHGRIISREPRAGGN